MSCSAKQNEHKQKRLSRLPGVKKSFFYTIEQIKEKSFFALTTVLVFVNDNAAIKYDLEAWFPGSNTYRELVSCTNCKDYQARKIKTRVGRAGASDSKILHTLNSTAIATERTICCILENYQQKDGSIKIPEVLIPYMNGKTEIKAEK